MYCLQTEDEAPALAKIDIHTDTVGFKKLSGISRKLSLDGSVSKTKENDMGIKKLSGIGRKLSLDASGSKTREIDMGINTLSGIGRKLSLDASRSKTRESDMGTKKFSGIGRNLPLEASGSNTRDHDMVMNELPSNILSGQSQIQEPKQDSKDMPFEHSNIHVTTMMSSDHDPDNKPPAICSKKLRLSGKNLQPEVLNATKRIYEPMPLNPQQENLLLISEAKAHTDVEVQKKSVDKSCLNNPKRKKLGLTGKKPTFGFLGLAQNRENGNNANMASGGNNMSKVPQTNQYIKGEPGEKGANSTGLKLPRKPLQVLEEKHNHNMNMSVNTEILNPSASKVHDVKPDKDGLEQGEGTYGCEGVIVLDSEDSEEEAMSKLSSRRLIARRRLPSKC